MHKGGDFGLSEEFHFQILKLCTTNEECDDDPSTKSKCLSEVLFKK